MSDEEVVDEIIDISDEIDFLDDSSDIELDDEIVDDKELDFKLNMGGFEE